MRAERLLRALLLGGLMGSAAAQEPLSADEDEVVLDDIVVTAQKRRESLQDTPVSVAAFNTERLELRGIEGLADLSANVPSMSVEPFPTNNATLRIYIRGIGLIDTQITQDPAVGVYADGVYIARSTGLALDIADLERIEVLRGPQGTLYGRNTTGGAVNLITKRPDIGLFSMSHKLGAGTRKRFHGRSSFNLPVNDSLAVKLAVLGNTRDGFVENTHPGGDFGDTRETGLRLDARWLALDGLSADYTYDRSDKSYFNYLFQAVRTPEANHGQAELFKRFGQANTVYSSTRLDALASGPPLEPSTTEIDGHAFTLSGARGAHELKYIVGYRKLFDATYADLGGGKGSMDYRLDSHIYDGPAADVANGGPTPLVIPALTQSQWSHELQWTGDLFDDALQFIAGAFYFTEEATDDRHRLNHQLSTDIDPQQLAADPELAAAAAGLSRPRLVNFVNLRADIENEALAAFGQATWTPGVLDERLHLTFGYRHSDDKRAAVRFRISDTYLEGDSNGTGTARLLSSAERFDNVRAERRFRDDSFSYIAAFDLSRDINVYAKSIEAYKSGGFNTRDPQVSAASGPASDGTDYGFGYVEGFDPEHVRSYELGVKSEWLEHRLRVNLNLFYSDYTDMQINFLIPGTVSDTKVRNAGKAEMRGLELDTTYRVTRGLTLTADYAYLDANVLDVRDINGADVTENYQFNSAPPHSFVTAADWTFLERNWGRLRAYLSYHYVGERAGLALPGRKGLTALPAYGVLNLRLGAHAIADGALDLALWGRNLLDEEYEVMAIDNLPHADRAVVWGEPRSAGLELTYRYY